MRVPGFHACIVCESASGLGFRRRREPRRSIRRPCFRPAAHNSMPRHGAPGRETARDRGGHSWPELEWDAGWQWVEAYALDLKCPATMLEA